MAKRSEEKNRAQAEKKVEDTFAKEATLFGTAIVGQKGQVVIPVSARRKMQIKTGDRIFVFGKGNQLLALIKADRILEFVAEFTKRLDIIRESLVSDLEEFTGKKKN